MRTVVTFATEAYSHEQREDEAGPVGASDLARWIGRELRAHGQEADDEIIQEDSGCALRCRIDGRPHDLVIGWIPGNGTTPDRWFLCVERHAGLLGTVLGARRRVQPKTLDAVHALLISSPVTLVRWHEWADFARGRIGEGVLRP